MKNNVTIEDIKGIESRLEVVLTNEQRADILKQYQRVVTDNADDWSVIIEDLIDNITN
jgi:hypothetical protein